MSKPLKLGPRRAILGAAANDSALLECGHEAPRRVLMDSIYNCRSCRDEIAPDYKALNTYHQTRFCYYRAQQMMALCDLYLETERGKADLEVQIEKAERMKVESGDEWLVYFVSEGQDISRSGQFRVKKDDKNFVKDMPNHFPMGCFVYRTSMGRKPGM